MNRGAFDFLTKPIDFTDLETTIDKTLRHIEMMCDARRKPSEAERAHASLSRYFSPEIARRLAVSEADGVGGEEAATAGNLTDQGCTGRRPCLGRAGFALFNTCRSRSKPHAWRAIPIGVLTP